VTDIELFTDGACSGNPGPGGWGVILRWKGTEKELCGGERSTTNNRMELTAVIEGLKALKRPCTVAVYTDSQYVQKGITAWIHTWRKKGRLDEDSSNPVANQDLADPGHPGFRPQGQLALGPRPCRPRRERAGRRPGPPGPEKHPGLKNIPRHLPKAFERIQWRRTGTLCSTRD